MRYIRPEGDIVKFDTADVIGTSGADCGFTQFDAEECDGVTQAVTKPF